MYRSGMGMWDPRIPNQIWPQPAVAGTAYNKGLGVLPAIPAIMGAAVGAGAVTAYFESPGGVASGTPPGTTVGQPFLHDRVPKITSLDMLRYIEQHKASFRPYDITREHTGCGPETVWIRVDQVSGGPRKRIAVPGRTGAAIWPDWAVGVRRMEQRAAERCGGERTRETERRRADAELYAEHDAYMQAEYGTFPEKVANFFGDLFGDSYRDPAKDPCRYDPTGLCKAKRYGKWALVLGFVGGAGYLGYKIYTLGR